MRDVDVRDLYVTWAPRIRRYLVRLVGESEADDLTQEVFRRAQRGLPRFRSEARLSTWLYRIATNAAIDWLRSASFPGPAHTADELEEIAALASMKGDPPADTETRAIREEMRRCILGVVALLPEGQRAAILLCDLRGLDDREAAAALGVSLENVKIRLHRGRKRLRALLESKCRFYRDDRNEFACEPKERSRG